MANKNESIYTLKIQAVSDLQDANKDIKNLGKSMQDAFNFKSSKTSGMLGNVDELQRRIEKIANTGKKGIVNSTGAKEMLNDIKSIDKYVENIRTAFIEIENNPRKFFASDIASGIEKADANMKKLTSDAAAYNKKLKTNEGKIESLTGLKRASKVKSSKDFSDISAGTIGELNKIKNSGILEIPARLKFKDDSLNEQLIAIKAKIASATNFENNGDLDNAANLQKEVWKDLDVLIENAGNQVLQAKSNLRELESTKLTALKKEGNDLLKVFESAKVEIPADLQEGIQKALQGGSFDKLREAIQKAIDWGNETGIDQEIAPKLEKVKAAMDSVADTAESRLGETRTYAQNAYNALADTERAERSLKTLTNRLEYFFSLQNAFRMMARLIRSAFSTVQDLDKAMTETAVVTDYTVEDMWNKLGDYTQRANELGATTKGAYETATLYYQQGLNDQQAAELSVETMKMARIAGMDYAEATDAMTAALRGFNMQLTEASAQNINDVYSKLAAVTASDTQEIATSMSKVASLAANAGMDLETTATYLSEAIETTREAPENIGTALKTILARFQSLTKDPDTLSTEAQEALGGETVDANNVEAALRKAGVALRNEEGEFRAAKEVMLELNEVWDTLDVNTQRYIATQTAGARQQSRFIAMMSNYARTQELLSAANNSAGASQEQFNKTLESLDSKLNRFKNAWNEFTMGLANNQVIKDIVDLLTDVLTVINKLTGESGKVTSMIAKWAVAIVGFKGTGKILSTLINKLGINFDLTQIGVKGAASLIGGLVGGIKKNGDNVSKSIVQKITSGFNDIGKAFDFNKILKANNVNLNADNLKILEDNKIFSTEAIVAYNKELEVTHDTELALAAARKAEMAEQSALMGLNTANLTKDQIATIKDSIAKYQLGAAEEFVDTQRQANIAATIAETLALDEETKATFIAIAAEDGLGAAFEFVGASSGAATLGIKGITASLKGLMASLAPLLPYILAIGAAVATIKIAEWFSIDKQIERTGKALEGWDTQIDKLNGDYDELSTSIANLSDNKLDNLTKGTYEWAEALQEANNNVISLIDNFPELAAYTTVNSNGMMEISEEGVSIAQNNLLAQQKIALQVKSLTKAQEAMLNMSKYDLNNPNNRGLAYDSMTAEAANPNYNKYRAEAQSNAQLAVSQMSNEVLGQLYDFTNIATDTINQLNLKTKKQLQDEYYLRTGSKASEDLDKTQLAQMIAGYEQRTNIENYTKLLAPVFEQLGNFTAEQLRDASIQSAEDNTIWLQDNIENWDNDLIDSWKSFLNEDVSTTLERIALQKEGNYSSENYDRMKSARESVAQDSSINNKTQALNDTYNLTGELAFTQEEIEKMVSDGTYQGLLSGSKSAADGVSQNILDKLGSKNENGIFEPNVKKISQYNKELNQMLGLTGKNQMSAKDLADNWELVEKSINGSVSAQKLLNYKAEHKDQFKFLDNIGKNYKIQVDADTSKAESKAQGIGSVLSELTEMVVSPTIDANVAPLENKLTDIANQLAQIPIIGGIISGMFQKIASQIASIGGSTISWEKKGDWGIDWSWETRTGKAVGLAADSGKKEVSTTIPVPHLKVPTYTAHFDPNGGGSGDGGNFTPSNISPSTSGGGGGGGSSNEPYENPFDKLYNLEQKITKEKEKQSKLEKDRERLMKSGNATVNDFVQNFKDQIQSWETQNDLLQQIIDGRLQQIRDELGKDGMSQYITYDYTNNTTSLTSAAYNITDKDTGEKVEKALGNIEKWAEEIRDNQEQQLSNRDAQAELIDKVNQEYEDYQQRIYDAIVEEAQKGIDKLSQVNDSINDANSKLIDSINKSLEKERRARENEKTESDLADKRAQLAMLKADTSGANAVRIKQLEKELSEAEEDYTDTLIDQKIQDLQDQNDVAAEQRQRQIDLLQAIHDWTTQQRGINVGDNEYWDMTYDLMDESFATYEQNMTKLKNELAKKGLTATSQDLEDMAWGVADASIYSKYQLNPESYVNTFERIMDLLIDKETAGMGNRQFNRWLKETLSTNTASNAMYDISTTRAYKDAETTTNASSSSYTSGNYKYTTTTTTQSTPWVETDSRQNARGEWNETGVIREGVETKTIGSSTSSQYIGPTKPAWSRIEEVYNYINSGSWGNGIDHRISVGASYGYSREEVLAGQQLINYRYPTYLNGYGYSYAYAKSLMGYKRGGLADFTGPAWLDGTPSKPEIVLDAKDSANFLQLKDILGNILNSKNYANTTYGDAYYDININVDKISDDYDVDKIITQIEKKITSNSKYRNVNAISRLK